MSRLRQGTAGKTRPCPHCRTRILESAQVCPACRHHLRYDPAGQADADVQLTPFRVEGAIRHSRVGDVWEYSIVVSVRNERGEEIARKVVDVGGLRASESRTFSLAVEVTAPAGTTGADIDTR
jgi:uncharacterized protein YbaR (Trm112 family)